MTLFSTPTRLARTKQETAMDIRAVEEHLSRCGKHRLLRRAYRANAAAIGLAGVLREAKFCEYGDEPPPLNDFHLGCVDDALALLLEQAVEDLVKLGRAVGLDAESDDLPKSPQSPPTTPAAAAR